jgi:hypothetical protein
MAELERYTGPKNLTTVLQDLKDRIAAVERRGGGGGGGNVEALYWMGET